MREIVTRETRKAVLGAMLIFAMCFVAWLILAVRGAQLMLREETLQGGIFHLATEIEIYRGDHEKYPSSLEELESDPDADNKARVRRILHDRFEDKYEYRLLTNGFVIVVTTPDRW